MVAGATGIDLFLLVIDAAEGARPQTLEHLAILRLLGIEPAWSRSRRRTRSTPRRSSSRSRRRGSSCPEAEVVAVSAKTGEGLDELRAALARAADAVEHAAATAATRLWIDRVFTLRGIGTVVTGTLWSGSIGEGDALRVEPGGLDVRVRSVQVHDRPVERAEAGQRVAVRSPGSSGPSSRRGDALVEPGAFAVTYRLDVALEELAEIPADVKVHLGTADVAGARRRARALRTAAARRAGRRGARRPGDPPRRDDGRRRHGARPAAAAALRPRAPRAAGARRPRLDDPRARPGRGAAPPRRAGGRRARRRLVLRARLAR